MQKQPFTVLYPTGFCSSCLAAADVAILLSLVGLIPLLVHHMTAIGAEQQAGEQAHIIVAVGAFALLA